MAKAQRRSGVLTKKTKFKLKNERCKDVCQEYCPDDSQEEDCTDYKHEEDGQDDRCKKPDEASLFYGTHETQEVSEGEEKELPKFLATCKKNPGHTKFVPVKHFNINHLPEGHHDEDLVELIKATADLTVRVAVKMISTERPEFWPNTNQQYPFYDKRGSDVGRLGTGKMWLVNMYTQRDIKIRSKGSCPCKKCQNSDTPSNVWGQVKMYTATHVVFDELEARHTTCRLFFDEQDSPLVTVDEWTVLEANIDEDRCVLYSLICDEVLLKKLETKRRLFWDLWEKVKNKSKSSRDNLTFIVSHPHGCYKQISVGQWINRYVVSDVKTKYTYTTGTCPGSSGARVYTLGYDGYWLSYVRHVHSGVNSEGINFSATGWDR